MSYQLPKITDQDLEITYSRKKKSSSCSTTSTSSTSSSNDSGISKRLPTATPVDFMTKRRTMPSKFCPKAKPPTMQYQPLKINESKAPKIPYISRPLRHMPKMPLVDPEINMEAFRTYRKMEFEKAQAAKANGGYEEPPTKKRTQAKRKEFWELNH
ncbi:hypothetical protein CAEBREN_14517 [Caenorhabditis brenneri]|uniref:Uncharacterized protein n=1 Tax=Caenorhabditis brenneri TaxID=135651 RepID=G0MLL3_CAEBE|nr:hypothetical protein CAEBREN_14517 [Caenorhabditis brenneri]